MTDINDFMTVPQAAASLKMSDRAVRKALDEGRLTPQYVLGKRLLLRAEVAAYKPSAREGIRPKLRGLPPGPPRPRGRPRKPQPDTPAPIPTLPE